jgi:hypothetical protein
MRVLSSSQEPYRPPPPKGQPESAMPAPTAAITKQCPLTIPPHNLRPSSLHQGSAADLMAWTFQEAAMIARRMERDESYESDIKLINTK